MINSTPLNTDSLNEDETDYSGGISVQPDLGQAPLYVDLLIADNDLVFDGADEPILCANKTSVVQDTKHLIRESGLLVRCVGERDGAKIDTLLLDLELMIEEDERLIPGTISIQRPSVGRVYVLSETADHGKFGFEASHLPL